MFWEVGVEALEQRAEICVKHLKSFGDVGTRVLESRGVYGWNE